MHRSGDLAGAERAYEAVLRDEPDHPDALHFLGVLRLGRGQRDEAVRLFGLSLRHAPGNPACLSNLGSALHALGRHEEAEARTREALSHAPGNPEILANLGSVTCALGRYAEAVALCEEALARGANPARVQSKRGIALCALDRHEEAIAAFDAALGADERLAESHRNRGVALHALARDQEAIESYRRAIALDAEDVDAHWNLGHALLRAGHYAEGWTEYEWRWRQAGARRDAERIRGGRWTGNEPLEGATLLVYAEQGMGDTLMAARYVPLLADRGARVVLEVQPRLQSLLSRLPGAERVIARGEPLPRFDLQCPLFSLPRVFGTRAQNVPASVPYLPVDQARAAHWRARLAAAPGLRVGIVWSGARSYGADGKRSIPVAQMVPLLGIPDITWYALQNDIDPEAAAVLDGFPGVTRIGRELPDFSEVAAFVANLDLVLTVDTSFGHVAGGLGRPVWVMLARSPDWRWMLDREDSVWYPTARLFRQDAEGTWEPVVRRVAEALRATGSARRANGT